MLSSVINGQLAPSSVPGEVVCVIFYRVKISFSFCRLDHKNKFKKKKLFIFYV